MINLFLIKNHFNYKNIFYINFHNFIIKWLNISFNFLNQ